MTGSYSLNSEQFVAVSALPGPDRYQHFVARVADWQLVWSLKDQDGWASAADDSGDHAFPVWPHPDYAMACATGSWSGNSPAPIDTREFLERWLPGMATDGVAAAVFPTTTMRGVVVPALKLQQAILDELSGIE